MWTLVGAGIKKVDQSARLMSDVLPQECVHYQQKVAEFNPEANEVTLSNGEVVSIRPYTLVVIHFIFQRLHLTCTKCLYIN